MIIAVDFDGTVVAHRYPSIGKDIGAVPVLKELIEKEHKLILNTMRSGECLESARKWFEKNNIPIYSVNHCPGQSRWTKSSKTYAHLYIDDLSLGIPLIIDESEHKPYVDWKRVRELLIKKGIL